MLTEKIGIIKRIFYVFFIMYLFPCSILASEPDLVLSTWAKPPLSKVDHTGYLDKIIIEAFRRIDLEIDILQKPVQRSISDANNGKGDGEYIRISGLSRIYPNLIEVPEKVFDFEFVVFTKNHDVIINGWDSLKPYDVGIVIGWKILEENIRNVRNRVDVPTPESLFKMLALGRIDIAVYSRYLGSEIVKNLGLKNIFVKNSPLAVKPMYLYLHRKHQGIIPDLAKNLSDMKKDGTFSKIKNEYLLNNTVDSFKLR